MKMKKILYILLIPIFYFSLLACPPDPGDKPCPPFCDPIDTTDTIKPILPYDLVWQIPLFEQDTQYSITSFYNTYYENMVFTSKRKGFTYNEIVIAFDTLGNKIWEWEDHIKQPNYLYEGNQLDQKLLYVSSGREVHGINIDDGTTNFQTRELNYYQSGIISFTSGHLYHVFDDYYSVGNKKSRVVVYDTGSNKWDIVYTIKQTDEYDVHLYPPGSWINEDSDTILVIPERKTNETGVGRRLRVDLHSYNASADTLLWIAKDIDTSAFALHNVNNPPIIDGDRIYILLSRALHCFDKYTGEKIWETRFDNTGGALGTNYILADDKIVLASGGGYIIGIDKITGDFDFFKDYEGNVNHLIYYDERIYYTNNHRLLIVDANNGGLLHKWKTHNYSERTPGAFSNGVAINPEQGVMYVQDGFFLMCIKIPE